MGYLGGALSGFTDQLKKEKSDRGPTKATSKRSSDDPEHKDDSVEQPKSRWQKFRSNLAGSFKKGGRVKKTGVYRLHKGEKVIPANKVKRSRSRGKRR